MYDLHDFIAGHVSHHASSVQKAVGPVARVFSPSENMGIVVSKATVQVHLGLQKALSVLRAAFIDTSNVYAAVFAVNSHRGLRLRLWSSGHRGGGPVVIAGLSLSLSHRNCLCSRCGEFFLFALIFGITFC